MHINQGWKDFFQTQSKYQKEDSNMHVSNDEVWTEEYGWIIVILHSKLNILEIKFRESQNPKNWKKLPEVI